MADMLMSVSASAIPETPDQNNVTTIERSGGATKYKDQALEDRCSYFHYAIEGPVALVFICLCFVGNILAIIVLSRVKRTPSTVLFCCLAAADLGVVLTGFLTRTIQQLCRYPERVPPNCFQYTHGAQSYIASYVWPFGSVSLVWSVWITVAITVNRYIAVCKPLQAPRLASLRMVYKQVIAIFFFGILFCVPRWLEYKPYEQRYLNWTLIMVGPTPLRTNKLYQLLYSNVAYFVVVGVIPLAILFTLTFYLVQALRRARAQRMDMTQGSSEKDPALTLTLVVVVVVFLLCQIPNCLNHVFNMMYIAERLPTTNDCYHWHFYYIRVAYLLVQVNSSVNFIIFMTCSASFRQQLVKTLTCKLRQKAGRGLTLWGKRKAGGNQSNHAYSRTRGTSMTSVTGVTVCVGPHENVKMASIAAKKAPAMRHISERTSTSEDFSTSEDKNGCISTSGTV